MWTQTLAAGVLVEKVGVMMTQDTLTNHRWWLSGSWVVRTDDDDQLLDIYVIIITHQANDLKIFCICIMRWRNIDIYKQVSYSYTTLYLTFDHPWEISLLVCTSASSTHGFPLQRIETRAILKTFLAFLIRANIYCIIVYCNVGLLLLTLQTKQEVCQVVSRARTARSVMGSLLELETKVHLLVERHC